MKSFTIQLALTSTTLVSLSAAGTTVRSRRDAEPGQPQVESIKAKAKSVFGRLSFPLFRREDYCVQDDYYNALISFPEINAACGIFLSLPPVTDYAAITAAITTRQVYTTRTVTQVQNTLRVPTDTVTVTTIPSGTPGNVRREVDPQALVRHVRRLAGATRSDFGSAVSSFCSYCIVADRPTTTEFYTLATATRVVSVQALTTVVSTNVRLAAAKEVTVTVTQTGTSGLASAPAAIVSVPSASPPVSSTSSSVISPAILNAAGTSATSAMTIAQTSTIAAGTPMQSLEPLSHPVNAFGAFSVGDIVAGNGLDYKLTNTTFTNAVGEGTTSLNVAYSNGTTINYSYTQISQNTVTNPLTQNGAANSNIIINGAVGSTIVVIVNQNGNNIPASTITLYSTIFVSASSTSVSSATTNVPSVSTTLVTTPGTSSVTITTSHEERSMSSVVPPVTSTPTPYPTTVSTITSTITSTSTDTASSGTPNPSFTSASSFNTSSVPSTTLDPTMPPFSNTSSTIGPTGTPTLTSTSSTSIFSTGHRTRSWHVPGNHSRSYFPTGTRPPRTPLPTGVSTTITTSDHPLPTFTPPSNTSSIILPTGDRSGSPVPPTSSSTSTSVTLSTTESTIATSTSTSSSSEIDSTSTPVTTCSVTIVSVATVTITHYATFTQPITITNTQLVTVTTTVPRWKDHHKNKDYWAA